MPARTEDSMSNGKPSALPERMLRELPYFASLDSDALDRLARTVRRRSLADREVVLTEGEPCDGLYFIVEGQVRLIKMTKEGREHVLRVLGPGAIFNDVAVFDGGPNPDGAVAVGATTVGIIPKSAILALTDRHPEVLRAALKLLSARQRRLGAVMEDLALRDVTARVARLLLGCLGKHEHIVEHAPDACARITHQEIAAMVGSVREVVQRALKDLERNGAIAVERGRIRVVDHRKLEDWADIAA
jgi:CRP/FNR family transcriptional regulator